MIEILGIIPSRGGSKGVPGKNTKLLAQKPLLLYTIVAAQKSSLLKKIILSSEDEKSIALGKEYNIEVPFERPASLAADDTPSIEVVKHAINFYLTKGKKFDVICLLQPTYPFRTSGLIDLCIEKFIETGADTLVTTVPVPHHFNPHWVFEKDKEGWLKMATGEKNIITARQNLPEAFIRDGGVYIFNAELPMEQNTLFGGRIVSLQTDVNWYVNIDTPEDWLYAEGKAGLYQALFF